MSAARDESMKATRVFRGCCNRILPCLRKQPEVERLAESTRSLWILLAEDNVVNQRVAQRMLEKMGHEVVVAANGRRAVDEVSLSRFDLVLMDVQMPEMDGFEATLAIRTLEKYLRRDSMPVVSKTAARHERRSGDVSILRNGRLSRQADRCRHALGYD